VRVAALYDVHGNLPALEAVLAEVETEHVDEIVVGGDVAAGPMPAETLALVRSSRARFIRGNADRVLDFEGNDGGDREVWRRSRLWVAEQLGDEQLRFLASLPLDAVVDVDGLGRVRFCHGAPGSDTLTITRLTPEARVRELLAGVRERVVVCGHTHVQFDRLAGEIRVANAGSVGAPYEARPGAYWLLVGPELSFRRTAYDVEAAAARIRATGYPRAEQFARDVALEDPERPARMSELIEGLP
jgi:diadenosine tetraphosphatase ApaH/serine/threonine PP2A family protein phosphatase